MTSHIDVVPTLLSLLGDDHPPRSYSDGVSMFGVPADRFVLATVGWEPRYAVTGRDLKATFFAFDAGMGGVVVTDPFDRPLADGEARFSAEAARILRAFRDPRPDGNCRRPERAGRARAPFPLPRGALPAAQGPRNAQTPFPRRQRPPRGRVKEGAEAADMWRREVNPGPEFPV